MGPKNSSHDCRFIWMTQEIYSGVLYTKLFDVRPFTFIETIFFCSSLIFWMNRACATSFQISTGTSTSSTSFFHGVEFDFKARLIQKIERFFFLFEFYFFFIFDHTLNKYIISFIFSVISTSTRNNFIHSNQIFLINSLIKFYFTHFSQGVFLQMFEHWKFSENVQRIVVGAIGIQHFWRF